MQGSLFYMMIATRRLCTFGALFLSLLAWSAASAQGVVAPSAFTVFLQHFDLGVSGMGVFTGSTSGLNYLQQQTQLTPSNTFGALIEVRYIASPKVGIVYNYTYARYVDNFNITDTGNSPKNATSSVLGIQSRVNEYSLGYIGHLPNYFELHPFVSVGGGVLAYRPTPGGGLGVEGESRGLAYAALGIEYPVNEHLGLRVQYRQTFFGASDFNENYLANGARSYTAEPSFGFYLRP
jgi:hypothetical protein